MQTCIYLLFIFPGGLLVKNLCTHAGDLRDTNLIPELGRCPGGGHGNPLQYSCLENPTNRGIDRLQSLGSQADAIEETQHTLMHRYVFKQLLHRAHTEKLKMVTKPKVLLYHFFLGQSCSHAFIFIFFYFNWRLIIFKILYWFFHTST